MCPPKSAQTHSKTAETPPKIGNVSKSESIEEKEDIDSDYYPEVILENLEREYDETHNPHRKDKKAKGHESGEELTDESEDGDIDLNYDWGKPKKSTKAQSEDSLNECESEGSGDSEELEVAKYQKYVYKNEQPMLSIEKKKKNGNIGRKAIDWDEDDFDSDSFRFCKVDMVGIGHWTTTQRKTTQKFVPAQLARHGLE